MQFYIRILSCFLSQVYTTSRDILFIFIKQNLISAEASKHGKHEKKMQQEIILRKGLLLRYENRRHGFCSISQIFTFRLHSQRFQLVHGIMPGGSFSSFNIKHWQKFSGYFASFGCDYVDKYHRYVILRAKQGHQMGQRN